MPLDIIISKEINIYSHHNIPSAASHLPCEVELNVSVAKLTWVLLCHFLNVFYEARFIGLLCLQHTVVIRIMLAGTKMLFYIMSCRLCCCFSLTLQPDSNVGCSRRVSFFIFNIGAELSVDGSVFCSCFLF